MTKYTCKSSIVLTLSIAIIIRHFFVVNYFQKSHSYAKHDVNIMLINNRNKVKVLKICEWYKNKIT